MKQFLSKLWHCYIWRFHDWTSLAQQGVKPTEGQVKDIEAGFKEYAKMYCNRCGHESELNNRL